MNKYDVVVVGGGHAGLEAAYAVDRIGLSCALLTSKKINWSNVMQPSNRRLGKSHIVRD